ncbi:hypothetical protein [Streptomyces sp. HNM0574]|uniref:hypothetical protein n=1 Tax=Streptomyces sp. HNM0574 TaxID=2714954 RepID=UPI00146C8BAA|nr:hypothetical protein [Streptomyces sp. HNM0574]NLU68685.1 hypothetical protein [Streptomyces sp. HNM0574]
MTAVREDATQVSVQISEGAWRDVETVFRVLGTLFETDRGAHAPHQATVGHPHVWAAQLTVEPPWERPRPTPLTGPVTAELQGTPQAVDTLARALTDAFVVREEGMASGDQERQVWLRLECHADVPHMPDA